jgi:hypothetical protein
MRKNKERIDTLDGEDLAEILRRVQDSPDREECARILQIVECMSRLDCKAPTRTKAQAVSRLTRLLQPYVWTRRVIPQPDGFASVYVNPMATAMLSKAESWERYAVGLLLDAVPALDSPPRIRRCLECRTWFFAAKRLDQKYCGNVCRQRTYDADPEHRASKAKKMRANRKMLKEQASKPKSGVGLRRGKAKVSKAAH